MSISLSLSSRFFSSLTNDAFVCFVLACVFTLPESVPENRTTTPKITRASSSTSSAVGGGGGGGDPVPYYTARKASIMQGNLIRMEEESSSSASSRKRNLIGWSKFAETENSTDVVTPITTTTAKYTTDLVGNINYLSTLYYVVATKCIVPK